MLAFMGVGASTPVALIVRFFPTTFPDVSNLPQSAASPSSCCSPNCLYFLLSWVFDLKSAAACYLFDLSILVRTYVMLGGQN